MARIALSLAVAACVVAVATAGSLPAFPNNWSSDNIQRVAINQGGVATPSGNVCCPADAPQCKVQTVFQAGIMSQWFDGNKTAFLSPYGAGIVTDYTAQKEYSVNSTKHCQAYCPLRQGSNMTTGIGMVANAQSRGIVSYNGRNLNLYVGTVVFPILNVTMEVMSYYIDESGASPVPVAIIQHLTPFGESLGSENQTFVTFTPGVPDSSNFEVIGAATCPKAKGCNSGGGGGGGSDDSSSSSADPHSHNAYAIKRILAEGITPNPELSIVRQMKRSVPKLQMEL